MNILVRLFAVGLFFCFGSCRINTTEKATAQTAGNDPTIKRGEIFSYSKSNTPKLFDLICFLGEVPTLPHKYLMTYRLCGISEDILQIKNEDLFLNNKLVDNKFALKHNYYISKTDFDKIKGLVTINDNYSTDMTADTLVLPMDDEFVVSNKIKANRQVLSSAFQDSVIRNRFSHDRNQDNFGPLAVPEESYFVLGDNRHNA